MKKYLSRISGCSAGEFLKRAEGSMKQGKKEFIITANPEILMKAGKNPKIHDMILEHTVVPDGISVVKAMKKAGIPVIERITGVDLVEGLLESAGKQGLSVYLLGAKEEVVSDLVKQEAKKYPNAVYNYHNGYDGDKDLIFDEIKKLQPDLVIVGLGVPAQELLISRHLDGFEKGIFIGVGGSLDVLSGHKQRAPAFFIRTNTEWLYRLLREPSRLSRFYENNIKFMGEVSKSLK